jgi:uncharacterized protein (DUF1800 family)
VIALNRLAFGPRPGDFDSFRALGATPQDQLFAYVNQQLDPENISDTDCDARLGAMGFTTIEKTLEQLFTDHALNDGGDWEYRIRPLIETLVATWIRAVYSERQLNEVLVDFWHNHFNVYGWDFFTGPIFVHYDRDIIRPNVFGNFREMLESVATSTAMLFYLDNFLNSRAGPNENWARELLELHSLGAENYLGVKRQSEVPGYSEGLPIGYVDDDIFETTRAFTGWRVDYSTWEPGVGQSGTFLYYDPWHDRFQKMVLGKFLPVDQPPMQDGRDVLDAVAEHPGTAHFIATKLCRRLIGDSPSETIIQAAADVFLAQKSAPDQLKRIVSTILLSDEFANTWGEKIKRPFEAIAGMLRGMDAEFVPGETFYWVYYTIGQPLFSRETPDGFPDLKEDWSNTTSLIQRWRLCNFMVEEWIDGISHNLDSATPGSLTTPNEIVDYWIDRILGRAMHPEDNRISIVEFLALGANPDSSLSPSDIAERVPRMVALLLMSPDFQWR